MKIGNLDLAHKLLLAPMAEVTDSSFRKIAKEHGAGLTFTQMVSALGVLKNEFYTLKHLSFHRSEKPIGVQLLGNNPDILGDSVKEITRYSPDLIDLNCGCPSERVVCNNFGAALLDDPKTLGKIIKKMVNSSGGIPISVKLRLGKDHKRINIFETAKTVEDNGVSMIVVHARTRADKYDKEPDWQWIKKVKEIVKIPVVGNGSVFTPQDAKEMLTSTGCDSVLVARGSLGNPFIFERFNSLIEEGIDPGKPGAAKILTVLLRHLSYLEKEMDNVLSLDKAKKNCIWYFKDHPGIDSLLENVFSSKDLETLKFIVKEHTEKILEDYYKAGDAESLNKKFKKKVLFWLADLNEEGIGEPAK